MLETFTVGAFMKNTGDKILLVAYGMRLMARAANVQRRVTDVDQREKMIATPLAPFERSAIVCVAACAYYNLRPTALRVDEVVRCRVSTE